MIGTQQLTIDDYKAIARRHVWLLLIPAVIFSIGAYFISLFLPARYKSETVVLVEAPAVSTDIVRPIGGDTNQRLATMREEILSRTRLQQIIEKFGLYREELNKHSMEELVARLRSSIDVGAVRPMDRTNASGLPGFTIDVVAAQPHLAQEICTEITSMFLQQNVIVTEHKADDQTEFISRQLQEAKAKLDDQDAKLADFQRHYAGALPDEAQTNFSLLNGMASQLDSVTQTINRAQQDKLFLESELSQQIAAAKLSQKSPDSLSRQLAVLQDQLASLRTKYTDDYPDVARVKREIGELQQRIDQQATASGTEKDVDSAIVGIDSPQVKQLKAQLHQIDVSIRERMTEQTGLKEQIGRIQSRLELTPAVLQQYKALTRDYQTALNIYNDFLKKQSDSEVSRDLLRRQQGEQFRVLDPPSLPQSPTFPNRRLFAFGGFAGGIGFGFAIAFLIEAQDTTLKTERDVEHLLKLPVLAVIPVAARTKSNGQIGPPPTLIKVSQGPIDQRVGA